jgi:hypothetical protein
MAAFRTRRSNFVLGGALVERSDTMKTATEISQRQASKKPQTIVEADNGQTLEIIGGNPFLVADGRRHPITLAESVRLYSDLFEDVMDGQLSLNHDEGLFAWLQAVAKGLGAKTARA